MLHRRTSPVNWLIVWEESNVINNLRWKLVVKVSNEKGRVGGNVTLNYSACWQCQPFFLDITFKISLNLQNWKLSNLNKVQNWIFRYKKFILKVRFWTSFELQLFSAFYPQVPFLVTFVEKIPSNLLLWSEIIAYLKTWKDKNDGEG